jgi:hypothetical protein
MPIGFISRILFFLFFLLGFQEGFLNYFLLFSLFCQHLQITDSVLKMFDAIGNSVVKLRRIAIGHIKDELLKVGEFRLLSPNEVRGFPLKKANKSNMKSRRKILNKDSSKSK